MCGTEIPVSARDFVVMITIDVDGVPRLASHTLDCSVLRGEGLHKIWFGKLMKEAINVIRREPADGTNQAREALLSWLAAESVEQAYGRQVLLSPCQGEDRPGVTCWVEGRSW